MPADDVEIDIELRSVQLKFPNGRGSISESCDQRRIPTDKGDVLVAIQGDTSKPAIITYHDLGLNCRFHYFPYCYTIHEISFLVATNFGSFFNYPVMRALLEHFCVYHITAPGQEENAPNLPEE